MAQQANPLPPGRKQACSSPETGGCHEQGGLPGLQQCHQCHHHASQRGTDGAALVWGPTFSPDSPMFIREKQRFTVAPAPGSVRVLAAPLPLSGQEMATFFSQEHVRNIKFSKTFSTKANSQNRDYDIPGTPIQAPGPHAAPSWGCCTLSTGSTPSSFWDTWAAPSHTQHPDSHFFQRHPLTPTLVSHQVSPVTLSPSEIFPEGWS